MAAINEEKQVERWYQNQQLLWQTRTIASYIAATVRVEEGKQNGLLEQALAIGEGVLSTEGKEEDRTPEGHLYNSYEKVMDVFGGRGSVQLTRAG